MSDSPVAIIDIGSNSIKILVAARALDGTPHELHTRTIDARISAGISHSDPRLTADGMTRGLAAIRSLLADAAPFAPARTLLVATSAVRDAHNGPEFRARVAAATGCEIRILTGDEEAALIGRGLTSDPALAALRDFYVFDLGGGSLECLAFRARRMTRALSLQLGCVRLTERFVADPRAVFSAASAAAITVHIRAEFARAGFDFPLGAGVVAVGTGGTVTIARKILAARLGLKMKQTEPRVTLADLRFLLAAVGRLPLALRADIAGLPSERADVFPAALATLIAVAELGGLPEFRHSTHNLRWGLAAEALA